jgi:uncharacterized protein
MFFWSGDILFIYGMVAFVFVQFRNLEPRKLLYVAIIAFIAPLFIDIIMLYANPGYMVPPEKLALKTYFDLTPQEVTEPFINGSFHDVILMNFHNLKWRWFDLMPSGRLFKVFAFFTLGFYLMNSKYFTTRVFSYLRLVIYIIIGVSLTFLSKHIGGSMAHFPKEWKDILYKLLFSLGQVNLALAYVSIISMTYRSAFGKKLLGGLKSAGRMSFSSYLSHTAFGIFIFYPFGLGYYGQFSLWQIEVMAIVIFAAQVLLAKIWLRYFSFGPLEWLWRSLTYGEFLSMRKYDSK